MRVGGVEWADTIYTTTDVATHNMYNTRLFQAWEEDSREFRSTELVVR